VPGRLNVQSKVCPRLSDPELQVVVPGGKGAMPVTVWESRLSDVQRTVFPTRTRTVPGLKAERPELPGTFSIRTCCAGVAAGAAGAGAGAAAGGGADGRTPGPGAGGGAGGCACARDENRASAASAPSDTNEDLMMHLLQ
jgi:hypothetical protein